MTNGEGRSDTFSGRVGIVFITQVFGAAVSIVNGILLARLLGPAAKGEYYLLILLPPTAMVLLQLGLPQAFGFFAARGQARGLAAKAHVLTAALSLAAFGVLILLLPMLQDNLMPGTSGELIPLAFVALPLLLSATFTTGIVLGQQRVRWYAAVNMSYPVVTTALLIVILGGFGASVGGAVLVYLGASVVQAVGFALGARQGKGDGQEDRPGYRDLFRYGLPFYPGSITQFFSYRADAFLIALLAAAPAASLGYYSMAVGLAELVFFFPNAVSTLFFPHVAGSERVDADRQVAMVTRVSLIASAAVAMLLAPGAVVMIYLLLPAFVPSLPALFILLPAVVALSATKVVGGYVAGIGRPGLNSRITVGAFVLNIAANLVLIPRFGIEGAAASSLLSYTASSVAFTAVAARLSMNRLRDFWIPRPSDVRFTLVTTTGLMRRVLAATNRSG